MRDTKIKICGINDIDIAKYIYNMVNNMNIIDIQIHIVIAFMRW